MQVAKCALPILVYGAVVTLAAQGGFVPALYRDGALPQIPIQAIGGGEAFLELTANSSGVVSAVRSLRATPPFTDAMSATVGAGSSVLDTGADASALLQALDANIARLPGGDMRKMLRVTAGQIRRALDEP